MTNCARLSERCALAGVRSTWSRFRSLSLNAREEARPHPRPLNPRNTSYQVETTSAGDTSLRRLALTQQSGLFAQTKHPSSCSGQLETHLP